jgi:hypothetical protein
MTREERYERLKAMWKNMPVDEWGCDETKFMSWQGMASTLLSYNSTLQAEFRDAVKSRSDGSGSMLISQDAKQTYDHICAVLSEAVNELSIPEEPVAPILTDEHGILWFVSHCTWKSRLVLLAWLTGAAITVLGIGFRFGVTDIGKDLYRQYMTLPAQHPTVPPTTAQPTASPPIAKRPDTNQDK